MRRVFSNPVWLGVPLSACVFVAAVVRDPSACVYPRARGPPLRTTAGAMLLSIGFRLDVLVVIWCPLL